MVPPVEHRPDLTFIVSSYDKPDYLRCCLATLAIQTKMHHKSHNVIVTDNSSQELNREVAESFQVRYLPTKVMECYTAAEIAAQLTEAEWLCFPSDDGLYLPEFADRMLLAARIHDWDFVYCNYVRDPRWTGRYMVIPARPERGLIDKGGFLVKRSLFLKIRFPEKKADGCASDAMFAEAAAECCRHGKVRDVLWFHG